MSFILFLLIPACYCDTIDLFRIKQLFLYINMINIKTTAEEKAKQIDKVIKTTLQICTTLGFEYFYISIQWE